MSIREIGCCGAYCKTCRLSSSGQHCRGCKLGYEDGQRDINRAKCRIKLCCFKDKGLETCADCPEYPDCRIIRLFHDKKGQKNGKYKQAIEFVRDNGYEKFLAVADNWRGPFGKFN